MVTTESLTTRAATALGRMRWPRSAVHVESSAQLAVHCTARVRGSSFRRAARPVAHCLRGVRRGGVDLGSGIVALFALRTAPVAVPDPVPSACNRWGCGWRARVRGGRLAGTLYGLCAPKRRKPKAERFRFSPTSATRVQARARTAARLTAGQRHPMPGAKLMICIQ